MQQNPLSQLNDIIAPEPIGWWPLHWGWYVIILSFMAILVLTGIYIYKRVQLNKPKKQTLLLLRALHQEPHPQKTVREINEILKRAMLAYVSREKVASLSGKQWVSVLNQNTEKAYQIPTDYVQLAYHPKCSAAKADAYLAKAIEWANATLPIKKGSL